MTFVKLDCGVLDSSLWIEPPTVVKVFLTMLAMCNPEGICEATAPGIARRAVLPLTSVRRALTRLEAPDPDDRSGVDDGRRIRRVPGGYLVINYLAYRQKDHGAAERKRRQRAREKSRVTSRPVTQAEAEAEGEGDVREEREASGRAEGGVGGTTPARPPDSLSERNGHDGDERHREGGNGAPRGEPASGEVAAERRRLEATFREQAARLAEDANLELAVVVRELSRTKTGRTFTDPSTVPLEWLRVSIAKEAEVRARIMRPLPM